MYPKSPFNKNIYINPKDDSILNYNIQKITCSEDVVVFTDIKSSIETISMQLYNLKISQDCCNKNPNAECSKSENEVRALRTELMHIKSQLTRKAKEIMNYYNDLNQLKVSR